MSALVDPWAADREDLVAAVVRLRGALADLGRAPGWEVRLMDHPRAVEAIRACVAAEDEFWRRAEAAAPRTAACADALAARCAAISAWEPDEARDGALAAAREG